MEAIPNKPAYVRYGASVEPSGVHSGSTLDTVRRKRDEKSKQLNNCNRGCHPCDIAVSGRALTRNEKDMKNRN